MGRWRGEKKIERGKEMEREGRRREREREGKEEQEGRREGREKERASVCVSVLDVSMETTIKPYHCRSSSFSPFSVAEELGSINPHF